MHVWNGHTLLTPVIDDEWAHMQWTQPSPAYADMVQQIKAHHGIADKGLQQPLKIVLSVRPGHAQHANASRVLENAPELAAALEARGFQTEVC